MAARSNISAARPINYLFLEFALSAPSFSPFSDPDLFLFICSCFAVVRAFLCSVSGSVACDYLASCHLLSASATLCFQHAFSQPSFGFFRISSFIWDSNLSPHLQQNSCGTSSAYRWMTRLNSFSGNHV